MAQKRQVKRSTPSRQQLVRKYHSRNWYDLPDWARLWVAHSLGYIALGFAVILLPAAMLALVAGFHSLPLEYFGIPTLGAGVGLAAGFLLLKWGVLVMAVRPLMRRELRGWYLLLTSALVHLAHSIVLVHAISGIVLTAVPIYLYFQTRRYFN